MKMNYDNTVSYIPTEERKENAGYYSGKEYKISASEIERRIKRLKRNTEIKEFTEIKETDGTSEEQEQEKFAEKTRTNEMKYRVKRAEKIKKCFINDDEETRKKKVKAMEEFYSDRKQVESTEAIIRAVFFEVFSGTEIDETAEDEIQNAAEAFLTKRSWDVEKHPNYRRQLLYTIKYNLIPNMLNKYFGLKAKGLSDEQLQERNFTGEGLRCKPTDKNAFRQEYLGDFDVDEEGGAVVYNAESNDGTVRIDGGAYMTTKEKLEEERLHAAFLKKIKDVDKAISRSKDDKLKLMWKMMKKVKENTKINEELAKKMKMTIYEIRALRRRIARYLEPKIKADVNTYKKEVQQVM